MVMLVGGTRREGKGRDEEKRWDLVDVYARNCLKDKFICIFNFSVVMVGVVSGLDWY